MTKQDLVIRVAEQTGSTQLEVGEVIQRTLDAIVAALVSPGRIELRGFGVFQVRKRAARLGRNPRTGEQIQVPEKLVVSFVPGKEVEDRVRLLAGAETPNRDAA